MKQTATDAPPRLAPIEYEPGLIEESVRWAIEHGAPGVGSRKLRRLRFGLGRRLDSVYGLPGREQREPAFRDLFAALFDELDLASWVPRWLEPFPRLRTDLECVLVRCATTAGEEGAELWESREQRGKGVPSYLVITVPPPGLRHPEELRAWLLPFLQRAADLLDPEFGFRREDLARGTRAEQQRLGAVYQRLWELSARARLQAQGLLEEPRLLPELQALLADSVGADGTTIDLLAALTSRASHQQLLALSHRLAGETWPHVSGTSARCPLCHYPTTDWAADEALVPVGAAIRADFPEWSSGDGCCGHCAERYELLSIADNI